MTQITKEAIEAASAAYTGTSWQFVSDHTKAHVRICMELALKAALPFLPIAVEGKAPEELSGPLQWAMAEAFEASEADTTAGKMIAVYDVVRAALASSPGKDGGQEVEADAKPVAFISPDVLKTLEDGTSGLFAMASPKWMKEGLTVGLYTRPQPASTALVERLTKALDGLNVQYGAPDGISINEATRAKAKGIIRFALSANEDAELLHGMGSDAEFLRDLASRLRSIPVMHGTTGFDIDVLNDMAQRLSPAALGSAHSSREDGSR